MNDMTSKGPPDLAEISAVLSRIASEVSVAARKDTPGTNADPGEIGPRARAALIYNARRKRDRSLDGFQDLVGEPAWDILLCLLAADRENAEVSVSSACFASGVPATTGLRWVRRLEERGLIARSDDPLDGRRSLLNLTEKGFEIAKAAVEAYQSSP
jgi:DNA-binding MarR family transcriptional regulator